jgi:hypothetical protein
MELHLHFNGTPAEFGGACEACAGRLFASAQPINLTVSPDPASVSADPVRVRLSSTDWKRYAWITAQRLPDGKAHLDIIADDTDWPRIESEWERLCAELLAHGWITAVISP